MATTFSIFCFACLFSVVCCLDFQISRFDPDQSNILYQGDAIPSVGAIEMIDKITYQSRVGRVMYAETVPIWDSDSGKLADFTTHFTFTIDTRSLPTYGHGLAFFLAPVGFQIPPNSAGGFLGLYNTSNSDSSANQIVSVEFDSYPNPEWDPPYEHVGININSISSSVNTSWNASLHSGDTADVWIVYNASITTLSVSWAYKENPSFRKNSTLSYQIDLREVLPEIASIGFSSATGQNGERAIIKSWKFNSTLTKEDTSSNTKKVKVIVFTTVSVGVLFSLIMLVFFIWFRRRRIAKKSADATHNLISINDDLEGAGPRKFSYQSLVVATNNFSDERKLGEGGFGCVYKGYLTDLDIPIAVKKISRGSRQGKKEYLTEVKVISRLRHRNLVQLIGWCHDQGQFLLAYEFMPNGSLDVHLFGKKSSLAWVVRYKITLGFSSALLYLHEECEQCVVHRDIKSSNIMLDSNFNLKLGDFGLAKLMDHELGPQTTGLAGTFGYLAPEYVSTGKASKESDIYSFGVVILEIVTGRRSMHILQDGISGMGLVEWVWNLYGSGELLSAADGRLNMGFDASQVECLMVVGLWCAHPDQSFRPSIRQAIQVLNFEVAIPSLPSKMPVPIYQAIDPLNKPEVSSSDASVTHTSINVGR
ncbi:Concanavalin A-like lectin/glucanase superfamily [Heracleum sosnowskyi]|uniref:non-specific serine/threonine protein kinase n=1 Tax=Heracleum sosnowskyi TaxID=360622 RepID=A0AAD8H0R9_9APIA|nr:Concanavalin A-like lectin/glucanase superfamily [Heracleum sosnowskyi]KAK1358793.1 Concanavalin A-like lectin/glucanase superfamily [Heracleum sosnowskyi]